MNEKTTTFPKTPRSKRRIWLLWTGRVAIFVVAALLVSFALVFERGASIEERAYEIGEPAPRTVFSPFDLTYINEGATEILRKQESLAVPPVFKVDPTATAEMSETIKQFLTIIDESKTQTPDDWAIQREELPFEVSDRSIQWLQDQESLEPVEADLQNLIQQYLSSGVLSDSIQLEYLDLGIRSATVLKADGKDEQSVSLRDVATVRTVKELVDEELEAKIPKDRTQRRVLSEIFDGVLTSNLTLDQEETDKRKQKAADSVDPVEETLQKDELIIQRGMLITSGMKVHLDAIQKKLAKKKVFNKFLAILLVVFVTYGLGFIYLWIFDRKSLLSFRTILLIHTVFLITLGACKAVAVWPDVSLYLMPVALGSLLLALLSGFRLGMMSAVAMTVLVAPISEFGIDVMSATLLTSVAAVFASIRLRKRIQFVKVGAMIGGTYFLVIFAFQIFQEFTVQEAFAYGIHGFANGLLITTPIAFLLLPILEHLFNLTTDITLLELSDLNHPLLKRMIVEAPGTYHHSLVVSTLAESACEAMGANALLARVGCYFHDIGKIAHSEYFTENMASQAKSKHERLTPTMSCLVIMNHVKDGIELGKKYKLKERILQFIPEHQGQGVIYYFYKKAMDQAAPGEQINVDDFRYPGPKPQSRETAVAMLADSTEAASRSLKDPSAESIRQLVRKIINDKFIDGQLDECDLTLRDLHKIQESFVHNLMAIFHTRVTYPALQQKADAPDLFKEGQFQKYRTDK